MPIDYSKYPENWLSEIRPIILERAKHRCECCGLPNYSRVFSFKENGKTVWKDVITKGIVNRIIDDSISGKIK